MIRAGFTYIAQGMSWMVVAVSADGLCTVVPNDPMRAGMFDEEFDVARIPVARLATRIAASAPGRPSLVA